MNRTRLHPLAEDYLGRLEALAHALPAQDRHELLTELRGHLHAGLPEGTTDAEVRNLLDDLGAPEDIVAAATAESGTAAPPGATRPGGAPLTQRWGVVEVITVLALTAGAFIVPVVGPLVGICFAWASARWTRREKVVATVLTLLPLVALSLGAVASMSTGAEPRPVAPVTSARSPVQGVLS